MFEDKSKVSSKNSGFKTAGPDTNAACVAGEGLRWMEKNKAGYTAQDAPSKRTVHLRK